MLLFLFFTVALGASVPEMEITCEKSTLDFDCMMDLSDYYIIHWTVNGTSISMAAQGATEGWVGFAFAESEGAMAPADFVIGYVSNGEATVNPYRAETRSITEGNLDDSVTLTDVNATEEDGVTTIYFTRNIEDGTVMIDPSLPVPVNFAIGENDELVYHGPENRGFTILSFA
eukprot:g621.t1